MSKNYSRILLVFIFVVALTLRWLYLPQKAVTFGYDQARDAFVVQEIIHGDLKLLGPPVSGVPGLYHGVLYYYVITPAYLLGQGNPIVVAYWLSFLNAIGVFIVFAFAKSITGKDEPSLIAASLYAFSFEASQYANWLSNPALGIIFVPGIYLGIWLWLKKKYRFAPIITGLALGLSIQSNIALAYHFLPVVFWLYISRSFLNRRSLFAFFASFFASTLTMIVSEIKFDAGGFSSLWYLFSSQDKITSSYQFGEFVVNYLNQIGKVFSLNLFPLNVSLGGLAGMAVLFFAIFALSKNKKRESISWQLLIVSVLIAYAFALSFGGGSTPHITVGIGSLLLVMTGIIIWQISKSQRVVAILIMLVILFANLAEIISQNRNGQTDFAIQKDLVLSKEVQAIDYTYQDAELKPFSISTLTSPLYVNTLWSYLYNWYGLKKYSYLPYWVGHDQVGLLGDNLQFAPSSVVLHYFIIEPTTGIPDLYIGYAKGDQESMSSLVGQKNFGEIVVEARKMKNVK